MHSCQDIQKHLNQYLDNALEAEAQRAVTDHLAQCADCRSYFESEAALEKKLTGIIKEPGADDQTIWARGVNAIREAEFKQSMVGARQTWTVFKYLVPLAAAAMILLAILPLFIFSPPAIPEIVRTAVQEHRSFLSDQARMDIAGASVDEIREYFARQQNFTFGDCCCSLLKKKEVELKGARMCRVKNNPAVAVASSYQDTPVTILLLPDSALVGLPKTKEKVKECHQIWQGKFQGFNFAMVRVGNQVIGVVSQLNANSLQNMLQDDRPEWSCRCRQK